MYHINRLCIHYIIFIVFRKLYWTNANHKSPSIERSNLDGTGREVLINTDLFIPLDIIIDQNAKRIYWADDKEGVYFRIESAALDGKFKALFSLFFHVKNLQNITTCGISFVKWIQKLSLYIYVILIIIFYVSD